MMVIKKKVKNNLTLFLLFGLVGCASQIEVLTPSSQFLAPEASGQFAKGNLFLHNMNGSMLGVSLNETNANPSLSTAKSQVALGSTGIIGLHESIDLYGKVGTHSPNIVGAKIQLMGENQQNTYSGNYSLAINMGLGQNNYTGSGNENFALSLQSADYKLNRTHTTTQLGLIAGWRYEKYILFYGGLTQIIENIHGTVDYEGSAIDGETIDIDGTHLQAHIGWIYEFDQYQLAAEYSFQQMHWQGDSASLIQTFNFSVGFDF